nr:MAG TPA: hypothetical protein [Caudoviricetes sp.]
MTEYNIFNILRISIKILLVLKNSKNGIEEKIAIV